ncbi:retrotransposon protein, putative, ty1-copia subclass, partial [Tanacetum coccineum]
SAIDAAKDNVVVSFRAVDEPVVANRNTKDVNVGQNVLSSISLIRKLESIRAIIEWFANTSYGLFWVKRLAYLVSSSMDGLNSMLENRLWFIHNNSLILKKWNPNVNLLREDVVNVPVLVKLYGVHVTAFNEEGLSAIPTKLGTADVELKYTIVVAMPKLVGEGFYTCIIRVEYEWKPTRCACCKVFGHVQDECLKNIGSDMEKNLKKPSQAPRGVPVGPKVGFKPVKQVYRPVSKKNNDNTNSGNKKKDAESRNEVSNLNPFDVLNSVENDVDERLDYGTNSLLEQWKKTYANADYDYDPYDDDDMYEGQEIPNNIQSICTIWI